jgi:hypothetical protein
VVAACTGTRSPAARCVLLGCDVRVGADIPAKIGLNEVAIKMVLPDWAFTICDDRLSKRHRQRAIANARLSPPSEAVDVGFLDEVVAEDQVLERAVAVAAELADTSIRRPTSARSSSCVGRCSPGWTNRSPPTERRAEREPTALGSVAGMAIPDEKMEYRRLGRSGIKVSVLSFGSWVTFDTQLDTDLALECMQAAHDSGCNFFDNAEVYAGGKSETIMGAALRDLGWPRWSYVLTTKLFWGIHGTIRTCGTRSTAST